MLASFAIRERDSRLAWRAGSHTAKVTVREFRARPAQRQVRIATAKAHLLDVLADGALAGALADLGDIGAAEAVRELDQRVVVHVGRDGRLAQAGLEDLQPRLLVGQRDVDELVQAAGAQQRGVDDVGPGGDKDEDGGEVTGCLMVARSAAACCWCAPCCC